METKAPPVVQFLCDLSEASDDVFRESMIECGSRNNLQLLTKLGAIEPGPRPSTVTCRACDADHSEVIEYDADRRCYIYFCPEAGFVAVDDADLITLRFRPDWLLDWLVKGIPIISSFRRPPLAQGRVWHLGDAACGDALVPVIFARRVSSQAALDLLVSALRPVHPAGKGLVVTTSAHVARQVQLPNGFEFLDLGDISRLVGDRLIVDRTSLDSRVQGLLGRSLPAKRPVRAVRKNRKEPSRVDWREADKPLIAEMHAMILDGKARNATDAARAIARRAPGNGKEVSKVTRLATAYIKSYSSD